MDASWTAALTPAPNGVLLEIEVVPNASADKFPDGYNHWRKRLQARLRAAAQEGRANEALQQLLAEFFRVPRRHVTLAAGATSRQKRLRIEGVSLGHVQSRLQEAFDGR